MAKTTVTITPEDISLTGAPNWIQFSVTEYGSDAYIEIDVQDSEGNHLATLQKSCSNGPIWFNLNSVFNSYNSYNVPPVSPGWFDTGTGHSYRIVAKLVEDDNTTIVYESPALYVLQGYALPSESLDMSRYQYSANGFTLLTDRPTTYYVPGQKEFLSFAVGVPYITVSPVSLLLPATGGSQSVTINSNTSWLVGEAVRAKSGPVPINLKVLYKALTTSGIVLGTIEAQTKTELNTMSVSTCLLDIDSVLTKYPKTGIVRVSVIDGTKMISNELEYRIHPASLHQLRPVYFINKFGGWDTFNFDAPIKEDISNEMDTYNRSLTPSYSKGEGLKMVARTSLNNTYTIEGAPVSDDVARWLKELALSRVVLDGEGNYIIIEEFKLTIDPENRDMQIPTIKYRLSESYVNG